jgi:hypothetical protein
MPREDSTVYRSELLDFDLVGLLRKDAPAGSPRRTALDNALRRAKGEDHPDSTSKFTSSIG